MNRYVVLLAGILSALLTGCTGIAAYDSSKSTGAPSADGNGRVTGLVTTSSADGADGSSKGTGAPSANGAGRVTELITTSEAEMMGASYDAIRAEFPFEEVARLAGPEKGYTWLYTRERRRDALRLTLSRCSGDGGNKARVAGWTYRIEVRANRMTSKMIASEYLSPLVFAVRNSLARRKIHAVLATGVTCGAAADADKPAAGGSGTGFFVTSDGYIITNHHVIADASHIDVHVAGGKVYVAKVISSDPSNDVALLKVDAQSVPLPIARTGSIQKGAQVFTLGYPLPDIEGNELKATFGRVNALSGGEGDIRFLQIDVPIQPGNSGGPLITDEGSVIGITTKTLSAKFVLQTKGIVPQNVNYAVKSEYILPLLQFAHVEPGAAKLTAGASKDPSQFERSIVHILVDIKPASEQTEK